jgi:hypothetical protein
MSARTDILAALAKAGHTPEDASALLARADKEPQTPTGLGDPEFPTTLEGGHALIVEYGDEEIYGNCQCGRALAKCSPDVPIDRLAESWERHVMTEVSS